FLADLGFLVHAAEDADLEGSVTAGKGRRHDVLQHRQVGEYLRGLKDARDAKLVDLVRRLSFQNDSVEHHGTTGRRDATNDDVEQRRLDGDVRTYDRVGLRFHDLEDDIGEGSQTTEDHLHVCGVEHDVGRSLSHGSTPQVEW